MHYGLVNFIFLVTLSLVSLSSQSLDISPTIYGEKHILEKRATARGHVRHGVNNGGHRMGMGFAPPQLPSQQGPRMFTLYIPQCQEAGLLIIQGDNNHFMKCQPNPNGGYFQTIYVCPVELHSVDDTSKCIPPPDCSSCRKANRKVSAAVVK